MAAIKELEEMKIIPAFDMEKVETLKKGIPPIDIYTEYTGERPVDKGPNMRMLARISQTFDKKIEKLLNK
jgi:hypothetical protein